MKPQESLMKTREPQTELRSNWRANFHEHVISGKKAQKLGIKFDLGGITRARGRTAVNATKTILRDC